MLERRLLVLGTIGRCDPTEKSGSMRDLQHGSNLLTQSAIAVWLASQIKPTIKPTPSPQTRVFLFGEEMKKKYRPLSADRMTRHLLRFAPPIPAHDRFKLQFMPHDALERFRLGQYEEGDFDTLACRLNVGLLLCDIKAPDYKPVGEAACRALMSVRDRHKRLGKWGLSGLELQAIRDGLDVMDQLENQLPRHVIFDAFTTVVKNHGAKA